MAHRHGPGMAATATALAFLLAAGPVLAQARPNVAVVVVPLSPAAEAPATQLGMGVRNSLEGSGRFELKRLSDVLDADGAKVREARAQEGQAALTDARKLYNDLDTLKSQAQAEAAMKAFADTDLTIHGADLTQAWLMKIASLVANGENKAAELEIEKLLAFDATAQFSPNFFPPEEIAFAEKTRKAVAQADQTLEVRTVPSGAEVSVDGIFRGLSPLTVKGLAAGDHYVTARLAGYALAQQKSRPGTAELTLQQSGAWPRYQAVVDGAKKDPGGPGRDRAAKEFGAWAGLDQVVLTLVDVQPGAKQAQIKALRLDSKDGHNYAFVKEDAPLPDVTEARGETLGNKLAAADAPRKGGPVTHYDEAGGGNGKKVAGYALLGGGAVLLATGVVFGLMANGKAAQFRDTPQTDVRAATYASNGRTFALVADLSYLTGLVAAGAGGYLAFAGGSSGSVTPKAKAAPAPEKKEEAKKEEKKVEKKEAPPPPPEKKPSEDEEKKKQKKHDEDDLRNY